MANVIDKPAHRNFKIPPLTKQTISTRYNPRWMRFHFLEALVRELGWQRGAELGCLAGRTLGHLMARCKNLELIGVDLWAAQPENDGPEGWEHYPHDKHFEQCCAIASAHLGRLKLIRDWTTKAAKIVPDGSLDFVFIDADHSYAGCKDDIIAWSPKLKPTGYLIGHDINWPGVRKAVDELVPGYEIGPNVCWFRPIEPAKNWASRFKDN